MPSGSAASGDGQPTAGTQAASTTSATSSASRHDPSSPLLPSRRALLTTSATVAARARSGNECLGPADAFSNWTPDPTAPPRLRRFSTTAMIIQPSASDGPSAVSLVRPAAIAVSASASLSATWILVLCPHVEPRSDRGVVVVAAHRLLRRRFLPPAFLGAASSPRLSSAPPRQPQQWSSFSCPRRVPLLREPRANLAPGWTLCPRPGCWTAIVRNEIVGGATASPRGRQGFSMTRRAGCGWLATTGTSRREGS